MTSSKTNHGRRQSPRRQNVSLEAAILGFRGDAECSTTVIDAAGDLVLEISEETWESTYRYRVSAAILADSSAYFRNLLDPDKFSEGATVRKQAIELRRCYHDTALIPDSKLPVVKISDIGHFPKANLVGAVLQQFFDILHSPLWTQTRPSAPGFALLAVVADRFSATEPISSFARRWGWNRHDLSEYKNPNKNKLEALSRQRLLTGLLLGFDHWVWTYSVNLINEGSERWSTEEPLPNVEPEALWWSLPGGLEEELQCRREYILDTISSIQTHFLTLYTSKQRQCRLGYDSSPQCDSFQLGEMIRFFTSRLRTLHLQSTILDSRREPKPYKGSLVKILQAFQACPEYQIDSNHTHCGLRTKLIPILDQLKILSHSAICLECWKKDRNEYSWLQNPTGGEWQFKIEAVFVGCCRHNGRVDDTRLNKAMYTAQSRNWTPRV